MQRRRRFLRLLVESKFTVFATVLTSASFANSLRGETRPAPAVPIASSRTRTIGQSEPVRVADFGAIGDGVADDTRAVQAAAATGKPIHFHGLTCRITSPVTVKNHVHGPGKLTGSNLLHIGADNVSVLGLELQGSTASGVAADVAISSLNRSGLRIEGCKFTNSRVRVRNDAAAEVSNFYFIGNKVEADFSAFDYLVTQNDVLTVRGINGVWIKDNDFTVLNVHRVFKISDTEHASAKNAGSPYRSRNVTVAGNTIRGATKSHKQVFDLYSGTSDILITQNTIDVTGFGALIENKTGHAQNYSQNTSIVDNVLLRNDGMVVHLQGSHGAVTAGQDVGFQNAVIERNNIARSGSGGAPLLSVRFYDDIAITSNTIDSPVATGDRKGRAAVEVRSCARSAVTENTVANGAILFSKAVQNSNSKAFSASIAAIRVQGNSLSNADRSGLFGGIHLENVVDAACVVEILGNRMLRSADDGAGPSVIVRKCTLARLRVEGNIAEAEAVSKRRLILMQNTIATFSERGNSWN